MDEKIITKLFKLSNKSLKNGEFPVSAIIYKDNQIISYGYNKRNKTHMTIDHAEIIAIGKANKKVKEWRLSDYSMVVTLEPCAMCQKVINEARLKEIFYLVPRYSFKNQAHKTSYQLLNCDMLEKDKYCHDLKTFFAHKR